MAELFQGIVEIANEVGTDVTVRIDGDQASLHLGGEGQDGDLTIYDGLGNARIKLAGDSGDVFLVAPDGSRVMSLTRHGNLHLGGEGQDGDLTIYDELGNARIKLAGDSGNVALLAPDGSRSMSLTRHGNLHLGGEGQDGDLTIYDELGNARIKLAGDSGNVALLAPDGSRSMSLTRHGNLHLGGEGQDGDLTIYNSEGEATINMNGDSGDIVLHNADCAEEFESAGDDVQPGFVVAIDADGKVRTTSQEYDRSVVGVVSGLGGYKPGLILDRQPSSGTRYPVAITGKAICLADATRSPIRVGDLLTSSNRLGHSKRVEDRERAFGAIIGKALGSLEHGTGTVPVLVGLQ